MQLGPAEAAAAVERQPCPQCGVPAGSACRTRAGKTAAPAVAGFSRIPAVHPLETVRFADGTEAQPLIEALEILRELNATGARNTSGQGADAVRADPVAGLPPDDQRELTEDELNDLLSGDKRDAGWDSDGDYEWVR
ncbi:zinc finger domain-containing protein [Streptomyces sp. 8N706]|uniref:zinc finger domain-containing protein n=1 Tax=Streptomyces sp. 8N706 TaxID=3457416 RepID=UPI003FD1D597